MSYEFLRFAHGSPFFCSLVDISRGVRNGGRETGTRTRDFLIGLGGWESRLGREIFSNGMGMKDLVWVSVSTQRLLITRLWNKWGHQTKAFQPTGWGVFYGVFSGALR